VKSLVAELMKRVERLAPERSWGEISIAFLDDSGISSVNALHLDRPSPTDVISFAYPPTPPEKDWCGEVLVNVEMALREGEARGDVLKELALYLAHGCDHLGGADDKTEEQRRRMRRRELRWLREIDYSGIIA